VAENAFPCQPSARRGRTARRRQDRRSDCVISPSEIEARSASFGPSNLSVAPNLHVVKERLGHKDIRMTINVYGHMVPSVGRALAEGLDALIEAADDGPDNVVAL
jgi:hypothetical protein